MELRKDASEIGLSWEDPTKCVAALSSGIPPEIYITFIKERTRLHEVYIQEQARNKRLQLILSFSLILFAALVVLFAPQGREILSYWIGAALVIFSAGTVGFSRVWAKTTEWSGGVDQDKRPLGE